MILEIRQEGDPVLREPCSEVTDFGFLFQKTVDDMIETMRAKGMGLAAPQIGLSKKIFTVEFTAKEDSDLKGFPLTVVCNPKVESVSKTKIKMVEGCLSLPGREIVVKRPKRIALSGQDRYGKPIRIEAGGLYARALFHEIDHLNNTLIVDHIQRTRVVFIGTGTLGTKALALLLADSQYDVVGIVTGDKSAKIRGIAKEKNPIFEIAKKSGAKIIRTEKVKNEEIVEEIKKLKPELGVMADFGQIIPDRLIKIPKYGIVNLHPSLLPRHRGPSPVQNAILEGDQVTGVTLMLTEAKMDAGPVLAKTKVPLFGSETAAILKDYLADIGAALLLETLPYYLSGELKPTPQDEKAATYSRRFKKEDGFVDQNTSSLEVHRKIRAFSVWPKVYSLAKGKRVQLLSAHFDGEGRFCLDTVKPEGKKEMSYDDFKNGYRAELTFRP